MEEATKWPAGSPEILTHLEAVNEVLQAHPGMKHMEAINWLVTRLRAGTIYAEWLRDGNRRRLKIDFWFNPSAAILFYAQTVDAAHPFGRLPAFRALREDTYIWLARADLARCLASEKQSTGGRPPDYDWGAIEAEVFRLMNHHGGFTADDPKWNAQARLEEALKQFCLDRWQREPSTSTLRKRLAPWLAEWQRRTMAGN